MTIETVAPLDADEDAEMTAEALLAHMGLRRQGQPLLATALTGGVSSDIWLVEQGEARFVVKRAREQLKVEAEWHVPVDRGKAEAAWLEYVDAAVPGAAPRVLALDEETCAIALEYLDSKEFSNWKDDLLEGRIDPEFASALGSMIGRVHAVSAREPGLADRFANQDLFEALRIEPFLRRTAVAVPEVADQMQALVDELESTQEALIHGDFSPKNILVGHRAHDKRPVILDAECATWGDPAFDAAFCVTHLELKAIHIPERAAELRTAARAFETAYLAEVDWTESEQVARRIGRLVPALALARVAGASPANYLSEASRIRTRAMAIAALQSGDRFGASGNNGTESYDEQ